MIEIKISGKCKGCPACELDISQILNGLFPVETTVYCRNVRLCEHLEKYIAERIAAEQADEE